MADISKITLPSGTTYDIKDAAARAAIAQLSGFTKFLGVTTTPLTDGSTTNPIIINGESVTADKGSIATYGSKEFIFNGTAWQEFGDLSGLGALAFKNSASGAYKPQGTVSTPTFTGTSGSVSVSGTTAGSVTISSDGSAVNYTPAGTISQPSFTGSSTTFSGSSTPSGTVSLSNSNKTATVAPAASGTTTYTPGGSVSAPTISVNTAGSTTTIKNPTKVTVAKTIATAAPGATAPANPVTYYAVSGEVLSLYQLGYTTGDSITTSNVTVKTGDASYTASTPAFTGTGVRLVTDNISVPTSASFTGTSGSVSVSGTPNGSVSTPSFTGTGAKLKASFSGSNITSTGSFTPSGTVSQPTFTGTDATITVS